MLRILSTLCFFGFICAMIVMADAGVPNVFSDLAHAIPQGDKLGHLALYGVMAALLNAALRHRRLSWPARRGLLLGSLIVLGFALLEEASQHFFNTRTLDAMDALADGVGVALASALSYWQLTRQRSTLPKAV